MPDKVKPAKELAASASKVLGAINTLKPLAVSDPLYSSLKEILETLENFWSIVLNTDVTFIDLSHIREMSGIGDTISNNLSILISANKEHPLQKAKKIEQSQQDLLSNTRQIQHYAHHFLSSRIIGISDQIKAIDSLKSAYQELKSDAAKAEDEAKTNYETELKSITSNSEQKLNEFIKKHQQTLNDLIQNSERQTEAIAARVESALKAANEVAAKRGITNEAKQFGATLETYQNSAKRWMAATIAAAVIGLLYGYFLYLDFENRIPELLQNIESSSAKADSFSSAMTASFVLLAIPRVLIFSMIYFGLIWCSRNYSAARHNAVVNEHRANALATFLAFVNGTRDEKIQDAILMQAASCAFSPQTSGYMKDEAPSQENTKIVEIVREARNSK